MDAQPDSPAVRAALLVVDMQHDFVDPDGMLSVPGAQAIVQRVNALVTEGCWDLIVASKDWHPPDHASFASSHPGKEPGQWVCCYNNGIRASRMQLFPTHCVAGTLGAEFVGGLEVERFQRIILKGRQPSHEALSAFYNDAGRVHTTGLSECLRAADINLVYVCGLATEYCVRGSVLDALHDGFGVGVVLDCVAAIDDVRGREALLEMEHAGAALLQSSQLAPVRALKLRQQQQQAWAQRWPEDWAGAAEL